MLSMRSARIAAAFAVAVMAAGCGSVGSGGGATSRSASASASVSASAAPASPPGAAGCSKAAWYPAPVTVTHQVNVPPVPVIAAVRVAQHPECGYDRIVLDIRGSIPSYSVQYVQRVVADASGQVIRMPGVRYLVITVRPAQAHSEGGVPTVASGVHDSAYPALASWALAGDLEGVVRVALGLAGTTVIRTGELNGRLFVDVKE